MNLIRSAFAASRPSLARVQSLFQQSDVSVLFDPTASALYADAAGTTAAVTGGPVGLRLDVARGVMALGPERASQDGAWDSMTGVTASGPILTVNRVSGVGAGAVAVKTNAVATTIGATYIVDVVVSDFVFAEFAAVRIGGTGATSTAVNITGNGAFRVFKAIAQTAGSINLICSGGNFKVSISVREVLGNHATQGTTALCPILRETPTTKRKWLEAPDSDDALNMTFAVAPGTMYVGRGTAEGVEWSTETWGTTVNTVRQGRYNDWLIARSRDWSASEKALVESYYRRVLPVLGPELVVRTEFSTGMLPWITYDGNWSWDAVNGAIKSDGTSSAFLFGGPGLAAGNQYLLIFDISKTSGNLLFYDGAEATFLRMTTGGVHARAFSARASTDHRPYGSSFVGSIHRASVKAIL